jgi:hypothetical protein
MSRHLSCISVRNPRSWPVITERRCFGGNPRILANLLSREKVVHNSTRLIFSSWRGVAAMRTNIYIGFVRFVRGLLRPREDKMQTNLTPDQCRAMEFIARSSNGPGIREIARYLGDGYDSKCAWRIVDRLAKKGLVSKIPGKARSVRVLAVPVGMAA